jgi:pyruvate dehydrogenase E2 component (dihydrolipoamide acetyltransferase)
VLAKPPVRKLAKDLGVDLATVVPTGPDGTITRADVQGTADAGAPAAAPAAAAAVGAGWGGRPREERIPIRSVRRATAAAVTQSAFTAPHVTEFVTVDVTRTMRLVDRLRGSREFRDVRLSPLAVLARAMCIAVRRTPDVNARWDGDAGEIVVQRYVNLGIAAATPRGLVVPNIKDADRLPLRELAVAINALAALAREGRTPPSDMTRGTISITNVGVFGVDTGTPILPPGEAAIMAFGAVRKQPWVHKGKVRPRWVTTLGLSFDHRLVDGEPGSRFLADVAAILEDPAQAVVWG